MSLYREWPCDDENAAGTPTSASPAARRDIISRKAAAEFDYPSAVAFAVLSFVKPSI
jgi:hypothetical protein